MGTWATVPWLAGSKPPLNMCSECGWQGLGEAENTSLSFSGSSWEQEEGDPQKSRLLPSEAEGHLEGHIYLAVYLFMIQFLLLGAGEPSERQGSISSSLQAKLRKREKNTGAERTDLPLHIHKGPDIPASPPVTATLQTSPRRPHHHCSGTRPSPSRPHQPSGADQKLLVP